jgi:hypothetical protein
VETGLGAGPEHVVVVVVVIVRGNRWCKHILAERSVGRFYTQEKSELDWRRSGTQRASSQVSEWCAWSHLIPGRHQYYYVMSSY